MLPIVALIVSSATRTLIVKVPGVFVVSCCLAYAAAGQQHQDDRWKQERQHGCGRKRASERERENYGLSPQTSIGLQGERTVTAIACWFYYCFCSKKAGSFFQFRITVNTFNLYYFYTLLRQLQWNWFHWQMDFKINFFPRAIYNSSQALLFFFFLRRRRRQCQFRLD